MAHSSKQAVRLLVKHARPSVRRGKASAYQVGDWVRVKEADAVRATLDSRQRLRGLRFTANQWAYCGRTYQVERVVRRILDDNGDPRSISRTVALAGAVCDVPGSPGCGRACSLYFRDEWLEASPPVVTRPARLLTTVRVKDYSDIAETLDRRSRLDGVAFLPEMLEYTGTTRAVLRQVEDAWAQPTWKEPTGPWYILDGARCSGRPLGGEGACDRNCGLLWHKDWLHLGPGTARDPTPAPGRGEVVRSGATRSPSAGKPDRP